MPVKIFVGNLSSDTTNQDLRPLFENYGEVTECDVLRNFGFVHMQNEDEAERAINELAGTVVRGQRINVEKSTGSSKGGRGGGGGKMGSRGGRGRGGGGWGRGAPYGRDYDPYPPPRGRMYDRDPYDYYDRQYPRDRVPPRIPPPYDDLRPYDREDRLPPPRDPYDRYPPPRYPPPDRYPYDRLPPRPADPYDRPPPDYYRAYDGYDDPVGRPPLHDDAAGPPGPTGRGRDAANGFDERRPEPRPGGGDSYSSSYSSYYDRFYSKPPANGDRAPAMPAAARQGMAPTTGRMAQGTRQGAPNPSGPGNQQADQQAKLQTGPIYF